MNAPVADIGRQMLRRHAIRLTPPSLGVLTGVLMQRHPTVRSVAEYAGISTQSAHRYLVLFKTLGLLTWDEGADGTLRPLVELQPIGGATDDG
jgi:DNA-binding IclR family transcriptional regulator